MGKIALFGLVLSLVSCASLTTEEANGSLNSQYFAGIPSLEVRHEWRLPSECRLAFDAQPPRPSGNWMVVEGNCDLGRDQLLLANLETDDQFRRPVWNPQLQGLRARTLLSLGDGVFVGLVSRFSVGAIAQNLPVLEMLRIDADTNQVERIPLLFEGGISENPLTGVLSHITALELIDREGLLLTLALVPTTNDVGQPRRIFRSYLVNNLRGSVPDISQLNFSNLNLSCARELTGCGVAHWNILENGELVAWVGSFDGGNTGSTQSLVRGVLRDNEFVAVQQSSGNFRGSRATVVEADTVSSAYVIVRRNSQLTVDAGHALSSLEARSLRDFSVTAEDQSDRTRTARPNSIVPISFCRCVLVAFRESELEIREPQSLQVLHSFRLPRAIRRDGIARVFPGRSPTEFFVLSGRRSRVWQVEVSGVSGG